MTRKEKLAILNNSDNKLWVDLLKSFLENKEKGLWERYLNLIDDYSDSDCYSNLAFSVNYCISDGFEWTTTKESWTFWEKLHNDWIDYISLRKDINK